MNAILNWLDHRTGYRGLLRAMLLEPIPGGARWRYIWGSMLVWCFAVQIITGVCLWMAYSPSIQNAWASVLYIEESMYLGSLVRGIHHYAAQAMVVLLVLHFLQVVWAGAYRAPRECNFWLGLVLALLVLGLALTGYLLPWDQKGYYATQVATRILGATPIVGPGLQERIQGGSDYGQATLTRFFALHAGILPALLTVILVAHLMLFRRHGVTPPKDAGTKMGWFWPDQILKDGVACLGLAIVVVGLAWYRGAGLSAPADPAEPFTAARPEWYFLSLFRLLKFEWIDRVGIAFGAIVLPGLLFAWIAAMPLIAKARWGHTLNIVFTCLVLAGVVGLTGLAMYEDRLNPEHQRALAEAAADAARARQLALLPSRVPLEGPTRLLRADPLFRGPRLYAAHCAGCHHYNGHDGRGRPIWEQDPKTGESIAAQPTATDLGKLGSREWMRAILVDFENHFAPLKNAPWFGEKEGIDPEESEMANWSGDRDALLAPENAENLKAMIEYLMEESNAPNASVDRQLASRGRDLAREGGWAGGIEGATCIDCHETLGEPFDPEAEGGSAPDVAGYLSHAWLVDFLKDPGSPQHYGSKNHMPAYERHLTAEELDQLVRWLRRDYLPPPSVSTPSH